MDSLRHMIWMTEKLKTRLWIKDLNWDLEVPIQIEVQYRTEGNTVDMASISRKIRYNRPLLIREAQTHSTDELDELVNDHVQRAIEQHLTARGFVGPSTPFLDKRASPSPRPRIHEDLTSGDPYSMVEVDERTPTVERSAKQKMGDTLNASVRQCTNCDLHLSRIHALPGEGNLNAHLFLIAQAPGLREDREGRMFIGPSGEILDELLDAAGVPRKELYMTNLIKCKLPKNRRPKQAEIEACSPFLEKEIVLVSPAVIAPLGYYASRYALKRFGFSMPEARKGFSALYGRLFLAGRTKIFPLPHPSALLYNASFKPKTLEQYRKLRKFRGVRS